MALVDLSAETEIGYLGLGNVFVCDIESPTQLDVALE